MADTLEGGTVDDKCYEEITAGRADYNWWGWSGKSHKRKWHLCEGLNKVGAQTSGVQESQNFLPTQIQNQWRDMQLHVSLAWQEEYGTFKSALKAHLMKGLLMNM